MQTTVTQSGRSSRGFTLVEMLVVVAVMSVISAIAIPVLTDTNYSSNIARNNRNAQTAVMVYAAAVASGATFSSSPNDVAGVVAELNAGKYGAGNLDSSFYRMPPVDPDAKAGMMALLRYIPAEGGLIIVSPPQ